MKGASFTSFTGQKGVHRLRYFRSLIKFMLEKDVRIRKCDKYLAFNFIY